MKMMKTVPILCLLAACADDAGEPPLDPLLEARPITVREPTGYEGSESLPLVIVLHGFGASGLLQDVYFGTSSLQSDEDFLLITPEGTPNSMNQRFWNATDACCNDESIEVDDVAYIRAIIEDTKARYRVDEERVYLVGHSNGGFMSFRMACELSEQIAAIVSLAGATWLDASRCEPSSPVSIVQIHGTNDATISYEGGETFYEGGGSYPSAANTVEYWADYNGCSGEFVDTAMPLDLESTLEGEETRVEAFEGCPAEGAVELWTIEGGSHIPALQSDFAAILYQFLMDHPKL